MKEEKLIDLVLENYNVKSTPEVREMIREFIHCDLQWFNDNFVEEQQENDRNFVKDDDPEDECHNRLCDYSLCGGSDKFSYYDNCFR